MQTNRGGESGVGAIDQTLIKLIQLIETIRSKAVIAKSVIMMTGHYSLQAATINLIIVMINEVLNHLYNLI